jgi:shikimate kinase
VLIFLTGMMGSGKTTLGKQLAALMDYPFIDLDEYLVRREQKSIPDIFSEEGEGRFRELERKALESLVQETQTAVVATGGGLPCFFDNAEYLNKHGENIFLDVPVEIILQRLHTSDLEQRPLLAGKSDVELMGYLVNTLSARMPYYKMAKHVFTGSDISAAQIWQHLNQ